MMATAPVLIIDNNPAVLNLLRRIIQDAGHNAMSAHSPMLGLELAQSVLPSVILLDVMMPGMDGYEVCRRLRSNYHLDPTWIVIVTSSEGAADRNRSVESGADYHLVKPVDVGRLLKLVAKCKAKPRSGGGSEPRESPQDDALQSHQS